MAQATDAVWLSVLPDMKNFGPGIVKGAGKDLDRSGRRLGGRFGTALLAGTAAVATGAVLAGKALYGIGETFAEVENTIRVGTGATGKDLEGLVDSAKNVGRNVPAEFEAIGNTIADVNTRLGLTGPTLETFSSQALEAGRILGEEIDIGSVGAAFNQFKIEGEDTTAAMDHLFRVSQATGIGMNDLASQVGTAGPAMQQLGFSFEETTGMIGAMDKAGLNSSQMISSMSRSLVNLAKDGEEPADAFERTVGEIEGFLEAGDKASAIDLAGEVFGTRGAAQFIGALEDGSLAMDDLANVAGMTEDTILGAGEETMTFAEHWQMFKNDVLLELEPIAKRVFDAITDAMDFLTNTILPEFKSGWSGEDSPTTTFEKLGSAVKTVTEFFQDNWKVLGMLAGALGVAKIAMMAFNAVMRANPLGLIVTAISLVVAGLIWFFTETETGQKIIKTAWNAIKTAISAVWDWMKRTFERIKDAFASVAGWFSDRGDDIQGVWDAIKTAISIAWDWIKDKVFTPIEKALDRLGQWFSDRGKEMELAWELLKLALKAGWEFIDKRVFQPIRDAIDRVKRFFSDRADDMELAWDALKLALKAGWEFIDRRVFQPIRDGVARVKNFLSDRVDDMKSAWDGLKSAFKAVWDWLDDRVFQPLRRTFDRIGGWVDTAVDAMGKAWRSVANLFRKPINWVLRRVWDNGIKKVFDNTAALIPGVKELPNAPTIPRFAKGGRHDGGWALVGEEGPELVDFRTPGRVYTAGETERMLQRRKHDDSLAARFDGGGVLSTLWSGIKSAASGVASWVRGGLAKAAEIVLSPIVGRLADAVSGWGSFGSLAGDYAASTVDNVIDWIAGKDDEGFAPGLPPGEPGAPIRGAVPYMNRLAHQLAQAAGNSAMTMIAMTRSMVGDHKWGGAVDFHDTHSRMQSVADLAAGQKGVRVVLFNRRMWLSGGGWGAQPRSYGGGDPWHLRHTHVGLHRSAASYDDGGYLKPGMSLVANQTRRPEPVLTGAQWRDIHQLATSGGGGPEYLVVRDVDGGLIGRMQVEARGEVAASMSGTQRAQRALTGSVR